MQKFPIYLGLAVTGRRTSTVPADAAAYAAQYCSSASRSYTYSSSDANLLQYQVGDTNLFDDILLNADCPDVSSCATEYQTELVSTGLRAGVAILLGVITLLLWLLVLPCACSRSCRRSRIWCGMKEREKAHDVTPRLLKYSWVMLIVFLLGMVADVIAASIYASKFSEGSRSMMCETFSLPDEALNGNVPGLYTDPYTGVSLNYTFIGSTAVAANVASINGYIEPGAPDIEQVPVTLSETTDLQFVVEEFGVYLQLMDSVFANAANSAVGNQECFYCTACCGGAGSYTDQLLNQMPQTYAGLLLMLREGLELELTGTGLDNLRNAVASSELRIADFQTQFEDQIATPMLDQQTLLDTSLTWANIIVIVLIVSIIVPTLFILTNVWKGIFNSDQGVYSDPNLIPQNPFHASTGWCVSIWYAIIVFIVAGVLGLGGYMESATCETLTDFDTFVDQAWSLYGSETSTSADTVDEFKTTIDTCFKSTGSGDILGSIVVDETSGETAKEAISQVSAMALQFDAIYDIPPGVSVKFTDEPIFVRMMAAMSEYRGLYMLSADTVNSLLSSNSYSDFESQKVGLGGSADCTGYPNLSIAGSIGSWIQETMTAAGYEIDSGAAHVDVGGAAAYNAALDAAGINTGSSGTCPYTGMDSSAFGSLMSEKMGVLSSNTYRCDTIVVTRTSDDHASVVGTPHVCTYAQWLVYWDNLATTLMAKATAIDVAQTATAAKIDAEIRQPVQHDIVGSVNILNTGLDCRFLNARWNNLYAAMCWEQTPGLVGLAYTIIALGVLGWIAMSLQFVIWRHLRDNRSLWKDACHEKI